MFSLALTPTDDVNRCIRCLTDEYNTCSGIRSRTHRLTLMTTIDVVRNPLAFYNGTILSQVKCFNRYTYFRVKLIREFTLRMLRI